MKKKQLIIIMILSVLIIFFIITKEEEKFFIKRYGNVQVEQIFKSTKLKRVYLNYYDKLFPYFLINEVKVKGKKLEFVRLVGPMYIIPKQALAIADASIGYGIRENIPEERISDLYDIPTYGYDCGKNIVNIKNKKCHLINECIGTTKYVEVCNKLSSSKVHSFEKNIKKLHLENKKIFLRMDIAGAEKDVMPEVLKTNNNITGLALVIHLDYLTDFAKVSKMLNEIEKNFILVERNHIVIYKTKFLCKRGKGYFSPAISLAYINKNLVDEYRIAPNQSSGSIKWDGNQKVYYPTDIVMWKMIPTIIRKNTEKLFTFDLPRLFERFNMRRKVN